MAYRVRMISEVKYGEFGAYVATVRKLQAAMEEHQLRSGRLFVPTAGRNNEIAWETDYPDLAAFEMENEAFYSHGDVFEAFRSGAEHVVQGSARVEIWEDLPAEFPAG